MPSPDFDDIALRQRPSPMLKTEVRRKEVMALDTETLGGYCKLLMDSSGNYVFVGCRGKETLPELLAFLMSHRFRGSLNVFYNLNYDINAIIKYLPPDLIEELALYNAIEYEGLDIIYIPKKVFRLQDKTGKQTVSFYDIAQFYGGSLAYNGAKYLGMVKNEDNLDRAKIGTSLVYWLDHEQEIIKYCYQDCLITKGLGDLLRDTLKKATGYYPKGFISKASITKDLLRRTVALPDITKIPMPALRMAYDSYHGGRFEIVRKGAIGKASLFDIVSAYPYHISNLVGLDNGTWHRVRDISEKAIYGFYLVKLSVKYGRLSPVSYQLKNGVMVYPIIEQGLAYMTKQELEAYAPWLDYEVKAGYEFYTDRPEYPLRDYIAKLFQCKSETPKSSFEYGLYKILMNSIYGAFLEKVWKPEEGYWLSGKLFNPVWATMITALTRIDLWRYAQHDPDNVIGFATDSILFKGEPDLPTSDRLGDWSFEQSGEAIVVKSGIYQIDQQYKSRGLQKGKKVKTPSGEQYSDLFDYIRQRPGQVIYPVMLERPVSFREAMSHSKTLSFRDINLFTNFQYDIDINKDYKRLWNGTFEAGSELFERSIDSSPLII